MDLKNVKTEPLEWTLADMLQREMVSPEAAAVGCQTEPVELPLLILKRECVSPEPAATTSLTLGLADSTTLTPGLAASTTLTLGLAASTTLTLGELLEADYGSLAGGGEDLMSEWRGAQLDIKTECSETEREPVVVMTDLYDDLTLRRGLTTFFCCSSCQTTFSTRKKLKSHRARAHPPPCATCGVVFQSASEKGRHRHRLVKCRTCEVKLTSYRLRYEHELETHFTSGSPPADKPYSCAICDKRYYTEVRALKHIDTHMKETYSCLICSGSTESFEVLLQHLSDVHP